MYMISNRKHLNIKYSNLYSFKFFDDFLWNFRLHRKLTPSIDFENGWRIYTNNDLSIISMISMMLHSDMSASRGPKTFARLIFEKISV